jgi:hypothetical protein
MIPLLEHPRPATAREMELRQWRSPVDSNGAALAASTAGQPSETKEPAHKEP